MKMLYHYTTIKSLAYILDSRNFRFSRIDQQDDMMEAELYSGSFYTSSWSEDKDNIGLWSMYTNHGTGVAIGLPEKPFTFIKNKGTKYKNNILDYHYTEYGIGVKEPFLFGVIYEKNGLVKNREHLNKLNKKLQNEIGIINNKSIITKSDEERRSLLTKELFTVFDSLMMIEAVYKDPVWSFQKEKRYKIYSIDRNGKIPSFIDVNIDDNDFKKMQIIIGPNTDRSDYIIIESLAKAMNNSASIEESNLMSYWNCEKRKNLTTSST